MLLNQIRLNKERKMFKKKEKNKEANKFACYRSM